MHKSTDYLKSRRQGQEIRGWTLLLVKAEWLDGTGARQDPFFHSKVSWSEKKAHSLDMQNKELGSY